MKNSKLIKTLVDKFMVKKVNSTSGFGFYQEPLPEGSERFKKKNK